MLFSFFNGKQYDFSFFITTFVFRTKNNANQKGIEFKAITRQCKSKRHCHQNINNNDETK